MSHEIDSFPLEMKNFNHKTNKCELFSEISYQLFKINKEVNLSERRRRERKFLRIMQIFFKLLTNFGVRKGGG